MAYRELTMVEIKQVLRLWRAGAAKKRVAAQLTLDVKDGALRGRRRELWPRARHQALTDEQVASVVAALSPDTGGRTAMVGSNARRSVAISSDCSGSAFGCRRSSGC